MNLTDAPKSLINTVCESKQDFRSRLLKLALAIHQAPHLDRAKIVDKISHDLNVTKENLYNCLGVFVEIVRLFLEATDKEFNSRLLEIGFTDSFVQSLPLISNREDVVKNIQYSTQTDYGKVSSLKWRIDISLMNSALENKIPPNVILTFTLKDNRKFTLEVDPKMFHKLRFNVALMIKEMNALKSNNLTK